VLILSYTANLDYFEKFVLTETRRLQAIATIVSDPSMLVADPLAVNGAGVRYTSAFAACRGGMPFHPKLLVIAGHERATVAIGSGNMTLAGWHGSDEILTAFHADKDRGPGAVRDTSHFLRRLVDSSVRLSSEAIRRLDRTAELLEGLDGSESGPRVVSTLDGPIIEELPEDPVDELVLYSPFYDSDLSALRAVHERLRPESTRIYVQAKTSVDGDALSRWAGENEAVVVWCPEGAYRHGKLIEWFVGGDRHALTGSPNLSTPALLLGLGDAGRPANCELGVVGPIGASLAPPEVAAPEKSIGSLKFSADSYTGLGVGIVMLSATLVDNGELVIELARDLAAPARVQAYDATKEWLSVPGLAELSPGAKEFRYPAPGLSPGSAIRLVNEAGASNEVFISDPRRAQRKPIRRVGPEIGAPEELIEDGDLNSLFELAELMREVFVKSGSMAPKAVDPGPNAREEDENLAPVPGQTLADYLAATPALLPDSVVTWSLILPSVPGLGSDPGMEDGSGILTDHIGDSAADSGETKNEAGRSKPVDVMRRSSEHRRRQLRRFCERSFEVAPAWPNVFRAFLGRFVLNGVAADLWPDEIERAEALVTLVDCLTRPQDEPTDEEREAIACYVAIALAILRSEVPRLSVEDEANLRFKSAIELARDFDLELEVTAVEEVASELRGSLGDVVSGEYVLRVTRSVVEPTAPNETAIALLREERGIWAHDKSGVIVVEKSLPASYENELLRIAAFVEGPRSAVSAETEAGVRVACAWDSPLLLISSRNRFGRRGRLYKGQGASPRIISAGWNYGSSVPENLPDPEATWLPGEDPPSDALPLLRMLDL
jgi:hypothetical protein